MDVFAEEVNSAIDALTIRTFRADDLGPVMQLHKVALQLSNAYTGDGPWDDDLRDIENHYMNNRGWFAVGTIGDELVAMGAIRRISDTCAEIKRMRTAPEWQGKGIGKKILDALVTRAENLEYREIILETSDRQPAAEKLYLANGFVPYKKENIRGLNCTWFRRDL